MMDRFIGKVFNDSALRLLRALPTASVDAVITDPMYMVMSKKSKSCIYEWGAEPGTGTAKEFWTYHKAIYQECLRILQPGGTLAWAMGIKHKEYFNTWFGAHRIWAFYRYYLRGLKRSFGPVWMVQTREQQPIRQPDEDALISIAASEPITRFHPCPKAIEEMLLMVRHLSRPGDIIIDPFSGTGTTLVAAQKLGRRWIGCDVSRTYCQIAMKRLAEAGDGGNGPLKRFPACTGT